MSIVAGLLVFGLTWWAVLFAVLPWGVRSQVEGSDGMTQGTDPGAPQLSNMKHKLWVTTGITAVIWLIVFTLVEVVGLTFDNLNWFPGPGRE